MSDTRNRIAWIYWGAFVLILAVLLGGSWFVLTTIRPAIQGINQGLDGR